jgi:hypothetical protein
MKPFILTIYNKLLGLDRLSSLLFFTLFCIPITGVGSYYSLGPVLNLSTILSNSTLKITGIISQILTGLLEGYGT